MQTMKRYWTKEDYWTSNRSSGTMIQHPIADMTSDFNRYHSTESVSKYFCLVYSNYIASISSIQSRKKDICLKPQSHY